MRNQGEGSVYEAHGRWFGAVELPRYADGTRHRKVVSSKDKSELLRKLRALQHKLDTGQLPTVATKATVSQWITHWLETIARPELKPSTYITYRAVVTNHIEPNVGKVKLDKLTPAHIRAMHKAITDSGKSTRTAEQAHRILSKSLHDAVVEGVVPYAVTDKVRPPKVVMAQRKSLTTDEARKVLQVAFRSGDPRATRWATYLLLGARQAEVLGLQWDRVDFTNGTIDVSWQLTMLPLKPGVLYDDPARYNVPAGLEFTPLWRSYALTRPKTLGSKRIIPLPEPLAALLLAYRKQAQPNPWGLVWTGAHNQPIRSADDTNAWHKALAAAEVTDTPVHGARHTTATLLLEAGVDAHVVAAILGHTVVSTTRGYQHASIALARTALQNLNGLLPSQEAVKELDS